MRRPAFILAATLLAVLDLSPALAQEIGSRFELRSWAQCLAMTDSRTARKIVLDEEGAFENAVNKIGFFFARNCSIRNRNVRFQGLIFLGPVSEYILKREFSKRTPFVWSVYADQLELQTANKLTETQAEAISLSSNTSIGTIRSHIGLCLLKRNPANAETLLATEIESDLERQAVTSLLSDLKTCAVPGSQLDMTFDDLRGSIAMIRYKLLRRALKGASNA